MNAEIQKFLNERSELKVQLNKINNLIKLYSEIEGTDLPGANSKRDSVIDRINKIDKLVDAFREVCTHRHPNGDDAMMYEAHDSHKDYYSCVICGEQTSV